VTMRALLLALAGCHVALLPAPPGAIRCSADPDCPGYPDTQHCGYAGVDRPLVCLDGPPDDVDPYGAKRARGRQ